MEPPKETRGETETLDTSEYQGIPGQRAGRTPVASKNKKIPEGGKRKAA